MPTAPGPRNKTASNIGFATYKPPSSCVLESASPLEDVFSAASDSQNFGTNAEQDLSPDTVLNIPYRSHTEHTDVVIMYNKWIPDGHSTLYYALLTLDPHKTVLKHYFSRFMQVREELGLYASDMFWERALSEIGASENVPSKCDDLMDTVERLSGVLFGWDYAQPNLDSTSRHCNVSRKFLRLAQVLGAFDCVRGFRGVIFVANADTAHGLVDLFQSSQVHPFLRPEVLMSQGLTATFSRFKQGAINLLICLYSASDLDFPLSTIVIRFDILPGDLPYLQQRTSTSRHLIHFVEQGNSHHRLILSRFVSLNDSIITWSKHITGQSACPPPDFRSSFIQTCPDSESCLDPLVDPLTQSTVCEHNAYAVVCRILAYFTLSTPSNFRRPLFKFLSTNNTAYQCTLLNHAPLFQEVVGKVCASPSLARRSACLEACRWLMQCGIMDGSFFPSPLSSSSLCIDGSPNSNLPIPSERFPGTRCYSRVSTNRWPKIVNSETTRLYPCIFYTPRGVAPHRPLCLLASVPLPSLPSFRLFFSGQAIQLSQQRFDAIQLQKEQLDILHGFTLRVFRAITNKPLTCRLMDMPYFLAPIMAECDSLERPGCADIFSLISWDVALLASRTWATSMAYGSSQVTERSANDAVVLDRRSEFTRRYAVRRVRGDLCPLSRPDRQEREASYGSFLGYCKARRKNFEGLEDETQVLIEVTPMPGTIDYLSPTSRPMSCSQKAQVKYLIPELCTKFTIPASCLITYSMFPSIIHRLEEFLLVKRLNSQILESLVTDTLLHMALTAPSAGVEYDYERLELLGDAFLKYLASMQHIISNRSLLLSANTVGIPGFILASQFNFRGWHPPGFYSETESAAFGRNLSDAIDRFKKDLRQRTDADSVWLGDKLIADVVEAIIGAAYLTGGQEVGLRVTKLLRVPIPAIEQWADLKRLAPRIPVNATKPTSHLAEIEDIICASFVDKGLLLQAVTNSSMEAASSRWNERLEFLGDAIVDFLTVRYIFNKYPQLSPGELTLLKGLMVSNSTLAAICISRGLHRYLRFNSPTLGCTITEYESTLARCREIEESRANAEGRSPGQYWSGVEAPKALSDMLEALFGALYVSNGFTQSEVDTMFENVLRPFYDRYVSLRTLTNHPTKTLFELIQSKGCSQMRIIRAPDNPSSCHVLIHDVVLASAEDASLSTAARLVSVFALDALEGDAEFMIRICDCRLHSKREKRRLEDILAELGEGIGSLLNEVNEQEVL